MIFQLLLAMTAAMIKAIPRDPSLQVLPTLSLKVYTYYLHSAQKSAKASESANITYIGP